MAVASHGVFTQDCHSQAHALEGTQSNTTSSTRETAWFANIWVGKHARKKGTFKLDTGAEVTAVSQETYQKLPNAPQLSPPQRTLCGPFCKPLQVLQGQYQMDLSYKKTSTNQQVFIMKEMKSNLLGLPAIKALNLAVILDETTTTTTPLSSAYIYKHFPKMFQELGKEVPCSPKTRSNTICTVHSKASSSTTERKGLRRTATN